MSQYSNNTKIKKAHAINMKCYKIIRKLIPFLKEWGLNDVKMEVLWEWHGEFEKGLKWEDNEQSEMFEGILETLKNWPI